MGSMDGVNPWEDFFGSLCKPEMQPVLERLTRVFVNEIVVSYVKRSRCCSRLQRTQCRNMPCKEESVEGLLYTGCDGRDKQPIWATPGNVHDKRLGCRHTAAAAQRGQGPIKTDVKLLKTGTARHVVMSPSVRQTSSHSLAALEVCIPYA